MKIDMNKKYRTREGNEVRILCVDAPGHNPVIGYIVLFGTAYPNSWSSGGRYRLREESHHDLIEVRSAEDVAREAFSGWVRIPLQGRREVQNHIVAALREAGMLKEDLE